MVLLMHQPLLTVYIPTFQRPELDLLLSSLLPQLPLNSEVIVSDNCPNRFAERIVKNHSDKTQHIPILYSARHQNIGCSANIVRGIASGSGKYLWIIGDDDRLLPNSVSRIVNQLGNTDRVLLWSEKSGEVGSGFTGSTRDWVLGLKDRSIITAATLISSSIWRRNALSMPLGIEKLDTQYPLAWASTPAETISVLNRPSLIVNSTNSENSVPFFPQVIAEWLEYFSGYHNLPVIQFEETNHWNFVNVELR